MDVNSTRFPSGIASLADWLHGKGVPPAGCYAVSVRLRPALRQTS